MRNAAYPHRKDVYSMSHRLFVPDGANQSIHIAMYRNGIAKKPFPFIDNEITYFLISEGEKFDAHYILISISISIRAHTHAHI